VASWAVFLRGGENDQRLRSDDAAERLDHADEEILQHERISHAHLEEIVPRTRDVMTLEHRGLLFDAGKEAVLHDCVAPSDED